jgi:hypothetical protein
VCSLHQPTLLRDVTTAWGAVMIMKTQRTRTGRIGDGDDNDNTNNNVLFASLVATLGGCTVRGSNSVSDKGF